MPSSWQWGTPIKLEVLEKLMVSDQQLEKCARAALKQLRQDFPSYFTVECGYAAPRTLAF
jgi:hypothetical protein